MENMMDVERKRKQKVGKNKKKSWRKHVDVADIDEYFEEKRKEERTGGSTEKKSSELLFFVDKDKQQLKSQKKKPNQTNEYDEDEEEYVPRNIRKLKSLEKAHQEELKKARARRNRKVVNVWGQKVISIAEENDFLEPVVIKPKVKPSTIGCGKLNLEAVSIPDPGASYNPDFDSHQELLAKAHNAEVTKIKALQKINNKVKMVSVAELKKQSEIWLKEMSQGLPGQDSGSSEIESESEDEEVETLQSSNKPKTLQQKRKAKLVKLQEAEKLDRKLTKKRLNDIYRLKNIKKELKQAELKHDERIKSRKERLKEKEDKEVKRFSRYKYKDQNIDVQLSEDLGGSLRELKPEGNLLKDRFKSFQRRNIIEIRRPVVPHRKYKRRIFTKRSYNVPTIKEFEPGNKKKR